MGCDIHIVLEKKHDGKWVGLHAFPYVNVLSKPDSKYPLEYSNPWVARQRNYSLFADLASVRGEGKYQPRGVPDDVSELARMQVEEWGSDGHSHTHMLLTEAWPLFVVHTFGGRILDENRKDLGLQIFGAEEDENPNSSDNYRLIIWFDN